MTPLPCPPDDIRDPQQRVLSSRDVSVVDISSRKYRQEHLNVGLYEGIVSFDHDFACIQRYCPFGELMQTRCPSVDYRSGVRREDLAVQAEREQRADNQLSAPPVLLDHVHAKLSRLAQLLKSPSSSRPLLGCDDHRDEEERGPLLFSST